MLLLARELPADDRAFHDLLGAERSLVLDLGAEPEVVAFFGDRPDRPVPATVATRSRAVFDPTSITATRIGQIVAGRTPDGHPGAGGR